MSREHQDQIETAIEAVLKLEKSTAAQIEDGRAILPRLLEWRNDMAVWADSGVAINSDQGRERLRTEKPFLIPAPYSEPEADKAFLGAGNKTIAAKLARELGLEQATAIAQSYGKKTIWDSTPGQPPTDASNNTDKDKGKGKDKSKSGAKSNPWLDDSPAGEKRRIQFITACGTVKAASLARSAGRDLAGRPLRVA